LTKKELLYYFSTRFSYRISHYIWSNLFHTIFCHPKQMSYATALCAFTSYEQWTKKEIILVVDENGHNLRESRYLNRRTGV